MTLTDALARHMHTTAAGPLTLALLALAGAAAWCLWLLASPWGRCRRCDGTGTRRTRIGRPQGVCHACAGAGRRRRPGAITVHRFWWSLAADRHRARHLDQAGRARRRAGDPSP